MNYEETLAYLYSSLPMFSRVGSAAYRKDLTNTIALSAALGDPHKKLRCIHVAGTNGKGSTSHMLAAVLIQAGYKTGLYTSPHLFDFRERISINGELISKEFVVEFTQRIMRVAEEIKPSFFEITVAMAFDYFTKNGVEYAVIEVGLGGKLDSTNIITPVISVITNIGWDHMNILGDTLAKIAAEKAGIIKDHVPVVIGERQKETDEVFISTANLKHSPLFFASDNFKVTDYHLGLTHIRFTIQRVHNAQMRDYTLDLPGLYQRKNLITVLQTLEVLNIEFEDDSIVHNALQVTKMLTGLHGRWEVISEKPTIILEVAHNREGVREMLEHLSHLPYGKLHFVMGMVNDKDPAPVLEQLPATASYYFTKAQIPRALDENELKSKAEQFGLEGLAFAEVNEAINAARKAAGSNDVIVVCGSIFLVAEVEKFRH